MAVKHEINHFREVWTREIPCSSRTDTQMEGKKSELDVSRFSPRFMFLRSTVIARKAPGVGFSHWIGNFNLLY
jgi:hypothetical protein